VRRINRLSVPLPEVMKMLVCPNCGEELDLEEIGAVCTNCGVQVPLGMEPEDRRLYDEEPRGE
jgi:DNA-directed RNA polymerase subunit RPC12/RpoP